MMLYSTHNLRHLEVLLLADWLTLLNDDQVTLTALFTLIVSKKPLPLTNILGGGAEGVNMPKMLRLITKKSR